MNDTTTPASAAPLPADPAPAGPPLRHAGPAGIAGWVLFDWSMQPFFTLVTTFVFAPYFAARLAPTPADGQALWGYATAAAGLVIALMSPVLGAIADASGRRKPWVMGFGLLMAVSSVALWWAAPGAPAAVTLALGAFVLGTIGAEFATVFNNAMMPGLVPQERLGRLSGLGWACGYVGGLVSLALTLGFLAADPETGRTLLGHPPALGLDPAASAGDRASGPLSAVWFLIFVLPMLVFTPDVPPSGLPLREAATRGMAALKKTGRALLAEERNMARFLLGNMIAMNGLGALFAFGGIYAAGVFGWATIEIGIFGILLTITGSIGAYLGGRLDDRFGSKPVVCGALAILIATAVLIVSIDADHIFFVVAAAGPSPGDGLFASTPERLYVLLGCVIGMAAGPLQAGARTLLARLAPQDRIGQYYGLFALSGKVTSFLGPLGVALVTDLTGSQRAGASVLIGFFGVGLWFLAGVAGRRAPAQWQ
ncbi:MFS transporter [Prosthecomicrobium sp. N25]|uniref:MFS transporter n=1 Tax=Prosthecomicrobium sp. N25 TaxID=3129254 RepID=UPI003076E1F5